MGILGTIVFHLAQLPMIPFLVTFVLVHFVSTLGAILKVVTRLSQPDQKESNVDRQSGDESAQHESDTNSVDIHRSPDTGDLTRFDSTPSVQVAGFTPPHSPRDEQPDSPRESDISAKSSRSTISIRATLPGYEILVTPKVGVTMNSENSSRSHSRFFPTPRKEEGE